MLKSLDFVIVDVQDVAGARDFYENKLGLEVESGSDAFVQFKQTGGATFSIQHNPEAKPSAGTELWWFVTDADKECSDLQNRGVAISIMPKDEPFGRAFSVKDPTGNTVNILQLPQR